MGEEVETRIGVFADGLWPRGTGRHDLLHICLIDRVQEYDGWPSLGIRVQEHSRQPTSNFLRSLYLVISFNCLRQKPPRTSNLLLGPGGTKAGSIVGRAGRPTVASLPEAVVPEYLTRIYRSRVNKSLIIFHRSAFLDVLVPFFFGMGGFVSTTKKSPDQGDHLQLVLYVLPIVKELAINLGNNIDRHDRRYGFLSNVDSAATVLEYHLREIQKAGNAEMFMEHIHKLADLLDEIFNDQIFNFVEPQVSITSDSGLPYSILVTDLKYPNRRALSFHRTHHIDDSEPYKNLSLKMMAGRQEWGFCLLTPSRAALLIGMNYCAI